MSIPDTSPKSVDTFRGDNAHLVQSIEALLRLDAKGALVPHGVGGHARGLLASAAVRLTAAEAKLATARNDALEEAKAAIVYRRRSYESDAVDSFVGELYADLDAILAPKKKCAYCGDAGFYYLLPKGMNAFKMRYPQLADAQIRHRCVHCDAWKNDAPTTKEPTNV